ncbi:MAG: hypothetical protein BGO34_01560 [Bacteroidia bacterium 44-10]|nr:MAG: hypothetical protein BGO34_01560 [Bacteroidia bacterium 44-10]
MKDAYYFPHDSNAKDDPKCVLLIEQLGCEGYGIYWILIEILRDQPGYRYPVALLPALARRYNTSVEKVNTVVSKYELFTVEDNSVFLSESLIRRMLPLEEKRRKKSEAGKKGNITRWRLNENSNSSQCDRNATTQRSLVKESKVNKNTKYNSESKDSPAEFSFENVWEQYGKKGNRKTSEAKWGRLSNPNKALALKHIPEYVKATPDKQYRKNFETYINQEVWNDNVLSNESSSKRQEINQSMPDLDELFNNLPTVNK